MPNIPLLLLICGDGGVTLGRLLICYEPIYTTTYEKSARSSRSASLSPHASKQ